MDASIGKSKKGKTLGAVSGVESAEDAAAGARRIRRNQDEDDAAPADGHDRGDAPPQHDLLAESLAALSDQLRNLDARVSAMSKHRKSRRSPSPDNPSSESESEQSSSGDDASARLLSDEKAARIAAFDVVMQYADKAQRFRAPKGVDTTTRRMKIFTVPSKLRPEGSTAFRADWVRHAYDTNYSVGHFLESRLGALMAYMADEHERDFDTAQVFLADTVQELMDLHANCRFVMDRATSDRADVAAEGRIALAQVQPDEAIDDAPLARLTARLRKEAARKAMRALQRKAMERQAEALVRTTAAPSPPVHAATAPRAASHQHTAAKPAAATAAAPAATFDAPGGGRRRFQRGGKKPQGGAGQGAEKAPASSDA